MIDYTPLYQALAEGPLAEFGQALPDLIEARFNNKRHGDLPRWLAAFESLPKLEKLPADLNSAAVTVGDANSCSPDTREQIETALRGLMPWRKGPFNIHGVEIDTEWRSDWKWDRLIDHIQPLEGRTVLDIGCGSGYHCWRMAGAGAELVIGIDPSPLFVVQHQALQHFITQHNTYVLPLGIEDLPPRIEAFDTVFSMGVLYHRRSPIDHLIELRDCLRPGGELVLETLVVEGPEGYSLLPDDRYAKMRNTWFIPSTATLEQWLGRCGFKDVKTVDINITSIEEQRSTSWMTFDSLIDYLDPNDPSRTVESYPAPMRAVITGRR